MFSGFELWPMEEGRQYSEYSVESNPRTYMTLKDYRNLAWKNQQPWERNPNPPRSMRDYRDQWMSAPVYNVPLTYIPPASPHFTSTSQQQQPPPLSPVEQGILNFSKQVDNFIKDNRAVNVQANREIGTVESSLKKELDGFQSEIDQKLDILQESISKRTNQFVQKEEENPKDECLTDIMAEDQCEQQPHHELIEDFIELPEGLDESSDMCDVVFPRENQEEIIAVLTEEGSGLEAEKEPQKLTLQPIPMKLNPTANAQATKYPLPVAPSTNQMYILPSTATQSTPKTATPKATLFALLWLSNFKRLVANIQAFTTTSKAQAAAYIAWHSGWFGYRFGFGAPKPRHF